MITDLRQLLPLQDVVEHAVAGQHVVHDESNRLRHHAQGLHAHSSRSSPLARTRSSTIGRVPAERVG